MRRVFESDQKGSDGLHTRHGLQQLVGDVGRGKSGENKDIGAFADQVAKRELLAKQGVVYRKIGLHFAVNPKGRVLKANQTQSLAHFAGSASFGRSKIGVAQQGNAGLNVHFADHFRDFADDLCNALR